VTRRVLALALVVWFVAVVLYDVAMLGIASLFRSGTASRLLITPVLVNPVDAARTVALMAIEGTAAFGAASVALLRFTGGPGKSTPGGRPRGRLLVRSGAAVRRKPLAPLPGKGAGRRGLEQPAL